MFFEEKGIRVELMRASFVILHYMTIQDTQKCIDSIITTIEYDNYSIVVVDNGSTNSSGAELEKAYAENEKIKIIILKENLGFAKGNNLGYQYAKKKEKAELIIILNSDTIINDSKFINKILESYKNDKFYILGPDIITLEGEHQNPLRNRRLTKREVEKRIFNKTIFLIYYKLKKILRVGDNFNVLEKLFEKTSQKIRLNVQYKKFREDVVLQGACLIYSYDYIKNEENAFVSDTFMYGEEDLLAHFCSVMHYKMVYNPKIRIVHMDGSSTKKTCKNTLDKNIFFTKYTLEGAKILLNKMKEAPLDSED